MQRQYDPCICFFSVGRHCAFNGCDFLQMHHNVKPEEAINSGSTKKKSKRQIKNYENNSRITTLSKTSICFHHHIRFGSGLILLFSCFVQVSVRLQRQYEYNSNFLFFFYFPDYFVRLLTPYHLFKHSSD